MNTTPQQDKELESLLGLVRETERTLRRSRVLSGFRKTLGVFLGGLVLFAGLDLGFGFGIPLRGLGFLAVAVGGGYYLVSTILAPWLKRLSPSRVAGRMEGLLPDMKNRLVSCVDLALRRDATPWSPAFLDRLLGETRTRVGSFNPVMVVNQAELRRHAVLAVASVMAFGALVGFVPDRSPTAMARILAPWADIPPASPLTFTVAPGDGRFLVGDDFEVEVLVLKGDPERVRLRIEDGGTGRTLRYNMNESRPGRWAFTLSGLQHPFSYRVYLEHTWSQRFDVDVLRRPEIESIAVRVHRPEYLQQEPVDNEPGDWDVTGPEDGRVVIAARVSGQVARGAIEILQATEPADGGPGGEEDAWRLAASHPMQPAVDDPSAWGGSFPLSSNGWYRLAFENGAGHGNRPHSPARFLALPDEEPDVAIERPATDLSVSAQGSVPVVVSASDDFGLAEIRLVSLVEDRGVGREREMRRYEDPVTSDTALTAIDMEAFDLEAGGKVRYHAIARDRKGQITRSKEYTLTVTGEAQAEDRKLAEFTEAQTLLTDNLNTMRESQVEIQSTLRELTVQYAPALEKVEVAIEELQPRPELAEAGAEEEPAGTNALPVVGVLELDPETAAQLAAFRGELGALAALQNQNLEQAAAFQAELAKVIEQTGGLRLLPWGMTRRLEALAATFDRAAYAAMQQLGTAMQAGAKTDPSLPDLERMQQLVDYLNRDLQSLYEDTTRLQTTASRYSRDPAFAMARMEEARLRARASTTSRILRGLQDYYTRTERDLARLERRQERLREEAEDAGEEFVEELEADQAMLEEEMDDPLLMLRRMLEQARAERASRPPTFPRAPYTPAQEGYYVPPREQDTEEEVEDPEEDFAFWEPLGEDDGEFDEEERNPYLPQLGGPQARVDPRFQDRIRQARRRSRGGDARRREVLQSRQWQRLQELHTARGATSSERGALNELQGALWDDIRGMWARSSQRREEAADSLREALGSDATRQALAMAERLQDLRRELADREGGGEGEDYSSGWAALLAGFSMPGATSARRSDYNAANLPELDVSMRTVILGMQPALREELITGMREDGPAAYRGFIENYYRELTKVKEE